MRFDLTDLQLFLHVVEAGSITGGAARAHLSLASASERIHGMEETLGVALLLRGRRGVTATKAGGMRSNWWTFYARDGGHGVPTLR